MGKTGWKRNTENEKEEDWKAGRVRGRRGFNASLQPEGLTKINRKALETLKLMIGGYQDRTSCCFVVRGCYMTTKLLTV